jgi:hypothetical protein
MSAVAGERIDFRNGWSIDIHEIKNGEVYFQQWPPGVENQSFLSGLGRMPIPDFEKRIAEERQKECSA